jgi:L-lactate dehydrogenase complex protein LldG
VAKAQQNDEAKREMLSAIRRQLVASAPYDAVRSEHAQHHSEQSSVPTRSMKDDSTSLVERFRGALEAVVGRCVIVRNEREAADAISATIEERKASRVALSNSALVEAIVPHLKSEATLVRSIAASELFDCEIGVTGAQWGIAETGTLVLESERENHRLASLVPTAHIAILEAERIRATLAEVLEAISEGGRDALSRTVTFITGPSRTSDIELTLAIGVHGPQDLYVIVIERT